MKLFSTRVHGMLDYLTAGTLLLLPTLIKPSSGVATLMRSAGLGTLIYSLLTDYELGVAHVIPMKAHLLLDGMSGATFAAAPLLFADEDGGIQGLLVGLGLFELLASLTTDAPPSFDAAHKPGLMHQQ